MLCFWSSTSTFLFLSVFACDHHHAWERLVDLPPDAWPTTRQCCFSVTYDPPDQRLKRRIDRFSDFSAWVPTLVLRGPPRVSRRTPRCHRPDARPGRVVQALMRDNLDNVKLVMRSMERHLACRGRPRNRILPCALGRTGGAALNT